MSKMHALPFPQHATKKNLLAFQVELMSKIFQNGINYLLKVKYEAFKF